MLAIMGTSTCHVMNAETLTEVPGMCGVVDGGIVRGLYGYEAGQSGVGDIFGWFAENFMPDGYRQEAERSGLSVQEYLTALAEIQPVGAHGLLALDWESGNRSVLVDHTLSGLIVGLTLATRPEDVYRALIEATAFGTRKIVETFGASGVPVTEFIAAGGLLRNAFLMQTYANVLRMPVHTTASAQAPALGAAIHAAVAAGAYPDVRAAGAGDGQPGRPQLPARQGGGRRLRPPLRRVQRSCTTTSAGASTTSCTGCTRCETRPPVTATEGTNAAMRRSNNAKRGLP